MDIKGIIFDYGGTIDTNGLHWAGVFWDQYLEAGIAVDHDQFKKAYVHAERSLALQPLVKPHFTFEDTLNLKLALQLEYLVDDGALTIDPEAQQMLSERLATNCDQLVRNTIAKAIPTLDYLSRKYPLVLVSNFYGNITTVLESYQIKHYFNAIIESAVVGVRKPNPQIFQLGIDALNLQFQTPLKAQQVLVIGDSYSKDILPAHSLGCATAWLRVSGWENEQEIESPIANHIITDFKLLQTFV